MSLPSTVPSLGSPRPSVEMSSSTEPFPPTARQNINAPSLSRRSSDTPPNTRMSAIAFTQPLVILFAIFVGYGTSFLTAVLLVTGLNKCVPESLCPSAASEPRTRPRPKTTRVKRSMSEASTSSTASGASAESDEAGPARVVSSGLGSLLGWPSRRFKSPARVPAALRFNSYHELDKVQEAEEDSFSTKLDDALPADEELLAATPETRARANSFELRVRQCTNDDGDDSEHGGLTDGDSQSDGTSEADTLEDRCNSPAKQKGGFGSWFKPKSRRRAQSVEATRSDSSLSPSTAATTSASTISSLSSSVSAKCPIHERRKAKRDQRSASPSPSLSPVRPKLQTATSSSATCTSVPSPTRSFSLRRPKSSVCLRTNSLDVPALPASHPMRVNTSESGPSKTSALQRLRAKSPFSPKMRSPLASPMTTPPHSPGLTPPTAVERGHSFNFLRRKSWDSDRLAAPGDRSPRGRSVPDLAHA